MGGMDVVVDYSSTGRVVLCEVVAAVVYMDETDGSTEDGEGEKKLVHDRHQHHQRPN
jgi:hypothetical protein